MFQYMGSEEMRQLMVYILMLFLRAEGELEGESGCMPDFLRSPRLTRIMPFSDIPSANFPPITVIVVKSFTVSIFILYFII